MLESKPHDPTDVVKWIHTTIMAVDCLTKLMREDFFLSVLDSNVWNFAQNVEAKANKAKTSSRLRETKERKKTTAASSSAATLEDDVVH